MKTSGTTRFRFVAAILGGIAGSVTQPVVAQDASTARIVGRVIDQGSGRPVAGAVVRLDTDASALTDDRGWFMLNAVPAGEHRISVEMIGFEMREEALTVRDAQVNEVRLTIAQQAISLEPIEVSVRSGWLESSGFYEREQNGAMGEFIKRDDIDRKQPQVLTDLLRDVPGVRIHFLDAGRKHVRINRGGTNNLNAFDPRQELVLPGCEPDLYIDGQVYRERIPRDGTENKVDGFDIVEPTLIEGVEVYTGSSAPLQYQSSCGVILVWTRRGQMRTATAASRSGSAGSLPSGASSGVAPAVTEGARARLTRRFGGRLDGSFASATPDSISIFRDGSVASFAITDLRKVEQDIGTAGFGQRALRGAKWGFMLSAAGIVIAAASQEFREAQNGGRGEIADNSPRKPAFGIKVIGAGSIAGAFLGGVLWRYHRWIEIPIR